MVASKKISKRKALTPEASASISDAVLRAARPGADYNNVVSAASLEAVRLVGTNFRISPELDSIYPTAEAFSEGGGLGFGGELKNATLDDETGVAVGIFAWWIDVSHGDKQLLNLTAVYTVTYSGLKGREADAVRRFIDRVGRFAIYPYFRSLVSQFSWASEANLPILPILKEEGQKAPAEVAPPAPENAGLGGKVGGVVP
jgi:hypothetical protein